MISDLRYFSIDEIIEAAQEKGKKPLIVVLDELEDPHNVGSIIRSCEATGVDGIVIQKRNGVLATATVNKSSAGALNHMKICKVVNISRTLKELKENGFWIYGADGEADKYYNEVNYDENVVLVMGNEGFGIRPLVKKHCDFLVKLPMIGKISSLNVSNAYWKTFQPIDALTSASRNDQALIGPARRSRSEERRVGKECRSRWSPYH